jgi:K+-sensing histidine kinase KdpD
MGADRVLPRHRPAVLLIAAVVPLVVCVAVVPFRDSLANTNVALGLVLVVVAAASTGIRPAGVIAALSSAVWFDFFLAQPYHRFAITDRADIETTILLILVGAAVTEVALWGRRQQARASRSDGYLAGVLSTVGTVSGGTMAASVLIEQVSQQLVEILSVDACRFTPGNQPAPDLPRLHHDGTVTRAGHSIDVRRNGLPTDSEIEVLAQSGGTVRGRFLITAATRITRPSLEQRRVAVALADQVGAALGLDHHGDRLQR